MQRKGASVTRFHRLRRPLVLPRRQEAAARETGSQLFSHFLQHLQRLSRRRTSGLLSRSLI